ncbi:MAG: peptidylprolyl isomerase [Bacteroidales bacterium]|jgi:cyclophilin family peptidyl-prolyl cis-trans isomerase|nr:peptidylprolyl isomerase [Bacteroidales bacterium]
MKANFFKLLLIIPLVVFSCKGKQGEVQQEDITKSEDTLAMQTNLIFNPADLSEEPVFDIVTNVGTIRIKLYKETPLHRDNFVKLASENFYTGIRFHRVIKGFMIQTGDPLSKDMANEAQFGTGGPGYTVPAEILPQFKHIKGAVAAARRGDAGNPMRESSGSQFYIVEDPATCAQLDGAYTIFGETISGFEVIDAIAATTTNYADRPATEIIIKSVTPVL